VKLTKYCPTIDEAGLDLLEVRPPSLPSFLLHSLFLLLSSLPVLFPPFSARRDAHEITEQYVVIDEAELERRLI